ncbi:MAG: O-succinylhomoserine sulfhydrylase [Alphaproteobacteria bacterium]|jgi:O-succinylhomoserine sulfhydrylase|nr:O-succinylhomoserine sulfhydrylase [Alphaproteobacteria bacterium]
MGSKKTNSVQWRQATRLVRGGTERTPFGETSEGLFLTSGYVYDSPEQAEAAFTGEAKRYMYSRYGNPTVTMFEKRLALLEGAETCISTASGMAAVFAALASQLQVGDRIVASRALFGSCLHVIKNQLPKFGIECVLVDGTDLEQWKQALLKKTNCVFLESPSNPCLEVIDIQAVSNLAHEAGALVIVDNVFATPVLQHPLELGADIVMYSATKHIDGQGRTMGGAILTNNADFVENSLVPFFRNTGPTLSPFNAWVLLKGLETLDLRVERQSDNALNVAEFLSGHSAVTRVLYPGLKSHPQHELAMRQMSKGGTVVAFEVNGGKEVAFQVLNRLSMVDISNNLGDAKSLITHPATTTHQKLSAEEKQTLGISDGLVRLSVGLEDVEDLKEDLDQALQD